MNKISSEKSHFRRRMLDRYGLTITSKDFKLIKQIVRGSKYISYEKQTCSRALCLIDLQGVIVYIIWDRKRGVPITALPRKAFFDKWRIRGIGDLEKVTRK